MPRSGHYNFLFNWYLKSHFRMTNNDSHILGQDYKKVKNQSKSMRYYRVTKLVIQYVCMIYFYGHFLTIIFTTL